MSSEVKTMTGKNPLPFMKFKWLFIAVSVFFVFFSLYQITVKGLNFGVDFKGGSKVVYSFTKPTTAEDIRKNLESLELGDIQVIRFGDKQEGDQFMIRSKFVEGQDVVSLMTETLKKSVGDDAVQVLSEEVVGPKVGADLRTKGFLSVILACLLILGYVGLRFDFLFSPGAVVALLHDILISVGFFAYFGKEFNLPILAALLTILGYSINDTIVIYDRIRENILRLPKKTSTVDVINVSLTETLARTIVTSLTVFFVVVVLFFYGGGVLHDFSFCLIIGVVFGTYSSIFIAAPIYLLLQKLFPGKGIKVSEPAAQVRAA